MNRKLYKAAYNRVLDKKYFYRHVIIFVIGNFALFFFSLQSWNPAIYYLLTLIWMRALALHFSNAYPEVVQDFGFKNEMEEERAIDLEINKLKKEQKAAKKRKTISSEAAPALSIKPKPIIESKHNYDASDLV